MKDFEAKRKVAQGIDTILSRMYENVHHNSFDENIDFSGIPSTTLKDFWLYTAGFIGFRNNDDLEERITPDEAQKILSGKFILKYITSKQAEIIANRANVVIDNSDEPQKVALYTIQDGTYYINKNIKETPESEPKTFISLETHPVELHTDAPQSYVDPLYVLTLLRNTFCHESPYIKGNKLTFLKDDSDEIVISKMWLRGYTELFAKQISLYNSAELATFLRSELEKTSNTLSNNDQIEEAVELAKPMLNEDFETLYPLIKFFVKERLTFEPKFQCIKG